jgi:hypothetical protein
MGYMRYTKTWTTGAKVAPIARPYLLHTARYYQQRTRGSARTAMLTLRYYSVKSAATVAIAE